MRISHWYQLMLMAQKKLVMSSLSDKMKKDQALKIHYNVNLQIPKVISKQERDSPNKRH